MRRLRARGPRRRVGLLTADRFHQLFVAGVLGERILQILTADGCVASVGRRLAANLAGLSVVGHEIAAPATRLCVVLSLSSPCMHV
jgi:hypothetical protein